MHFEGEFRVPGRPEDVIHRFADVERMASCMPGAVLETQDADGTWHGGLLVSFGPKKIKFKGRVTVETDLEACTGKVIGRGAADMRAARVSVNLTYKLLADPAAATPTTICTLVSDAELTGVLADFARTGGQVFAKVLMEEFSRRAVEEFSKDLPPPDATPAPVSRTDAIPPAESTASLAVDAGVAAPRPTPMAISAHGLLWAVIKAKLLGLLAALGLRRGAGTR